MLSPHTLLPCLLCSLPSSLAFPLHHPSFPTAQVSSPMWWSPLAGTRVEMSPRWGWGTGGLGSPPTQKHHPAHGAGGSGRPSGQRGLESPELLPGTGREPQASLRSPAPLPDANRSAPKRRDQPLYPRKVQKRSWSPAAAPGQHLHQTKVLCFGARRSHAVIPGHVARPGSEGSRHEAIPPVEGGSSTRPQSPLRGLSSEHPLA